MSCYVVLHLTEYREHHARVTLPKYIKEGMSTRDVEGLFQQGKWRTPSRGGCKKGTTTTRSGGGVTAVRCMIYTIPVPCPLTTRSRRSPRAISLPLRTPSSGVRRVSKLRKVRSSSQVFGKLFLHTPYGVLGPGWLAACLAGWISRHLNQLDGHSHFFGKTCTRRHSIYSVLGTPLG